MYLSSCMLPTSVGEFVYCITVYELFASTDNKIYTIPSQRRARFTTKPFHPRERIHLLEDLLALSFSSSNHESKMYRTIDTITAKVFRWCTCMCMFYVRMHLSQCMEDETWKMLEIRAKNVCFPKLSCKGLSPEGLVLLLYIILLWNSDNVQRLENLASRVDACLSKRFGGSARLSCCSLRG